MAIGRVVLVCALALILLGPRAASADQQSGEERGEIRRSAIVNGQSSRVQGDDGRSTIDDRRSTIVSPPRLIDVPFVPQSEALCGGAAAAMVFRYWRMLPAYAEDFASLVDDSAEGIKLGDLTRAVRERGWRALPFAGTASDVRDHLARRRPVIALIEDRPGRYHYVVVVAWMSDQIVIHDPARGPFRVIDDHAFDRAWAVTNRTALLILPEPEVLSEATLNTRPMDSAGNATPGAAAAGVPNAAAALGWPVLGSVTGSQNCAQVLDEAVQLARGGDLEHAETLLSLIDGACSSSGAPRELAGIRFLQKRWDEAIALAERAITRDSSDMHAWQLLATVRFLRGDTDGALRAWNSRNEPRVDLARVEGLDRTHHQVVSDLLNLPSQRLLTASQLERAKRRVAELPALQMSRVTYSPRASGLATVDVAVVERPLLPRTWPDAVASGLHAATAREVQLEVASPTGNGELWTGRWRWWPNRPRVSLSVAMPKLWRWTGLWRLDGEWEREVYRSADTLIASERRRAAVTFGDWRSGNFRWEVSGALENWNRHGKYFSAGAAVERRFFRDNLALRLDSAIWPSIGPALAFGSAGISSAWRSGSQDSTSFTALSGLRVVSARAPIDVWPGADTGHVRAPLLRAHPLLEDGAIRESGLGRALAHTTLEYQLDVTNRPFIRVRWAAFVDAARQRKPLIAIVPSTHIDVGAGLRAQVPGAPGALRVDVARGLRDGNIALSVSWQPSWPGWGAESKR